MRPTRGDCGSHRVGATDRGQLSRIVSGSLVIDAVETLETPVVLAERPSARSIRERLFG